MKTMTFTLFQPDEDISGKLRPQSPGLQLNLSSSLDMFLNQQDESRKRKQLENNFK